MNFPRIGNSRESSLISTTSEAIIFTKFRENLTKNVDFHEWPCNSGVVEPIADGRLFMHPLLEPQIFKVILHTKFRICSTALAQC